MKKFIALLLLAILLAVLPACGNEKGKAEKYCWNCGVGITTEVSFCSSCGAEVKGNQGMLDATTTSTQYGSNTTIAKPVVTKNTTSTKPVVTKNTTSTKPAHTHVFSKATCESPATCSCGAIQGSALGHSWEAATKEKPRTCSVCKKVDDQDEITKTWFVNQYNIAKDQYIHALEQERIAKQNEISDLNRSIDDEFEAYQQELKKIIIQYYGNKTALDAANQRAYSNYLAATKSYREKITLLESEIADIEQKISNPSVDAILTIVTKNCGITSLQTYEYYSQYENCI